MCCAHGGSISETIPIRRLIRPRDGFGPYRSRARGCRPAVVAEFARVSVPRCRLRADRSGTRRRRDFSAPGSAYGAAVPVGKTTRCRPRVRLVFSAIPSAENTSTRCLFRTRKSRKYGTRTTLFPYPSPFPKPRSSNFLFPPQNST